ncbi:SDR family oxidoreductase [Curtobacterium sp. L3-7]|uniref:SDR family NAD(P)-dependent oxidoreductase n=1 Tax=Curtobacterium sp. L3-7 TaxID=3138787 RepID=UPI003B525622
MSRTALVTGAGAGLGAYVCRRLAEDGWQVVGSVRRPADDPAPGVEYVHADLGDERQVRALAEHFEFVPDIVVHNAVAYPEWQGTPDFAAMETVYRVNTIAPFLLTRWLLELPRRDRNDDVAVVVINSESIYHADESSGLYASGKAALRVLTTALAASTRGTGVAVSTLLLGPLATAKRDVELTALATRLGVTLADLTRKALERSNPDLVIDEFIDLEACYRSLLHLHATGRTANGALLRLDGGSAGSLI